MEAQSIKDYEHLEGYYWWFAGRRRIIETILQKYFSGRHLRILDWGCGPGGNFAFLEKFGRVSGVDASEEALRACGEKGILDVTRAGDLNEFKSDEKFDLVANLDVLEHISSDVKFLQDLKKHLAPGGYVLVTVPAYQFLWTEFDEVLGHKRRYTRKDITKKFNDYGYRVVKASYFVFFLSPAFILFRIFQKLIESRKHKRKTSLSDSVLEFPFVINWLFTKILFLEAWLVRYVSLPFGTSIIVLARLKQEN